MKLLAGEKKAIIKRQNFIDQDENKDASQRESRQYHTIQMRIENADFEHTLGKFYDNMSFHRAWNHSCCK
jgi:hypothetical protein